MLDANSTARIAKFHAAQKKLICDELRVLLQETNRAVLTSSFQSQSLPLLHLISVLAPDIPVVFLDTGYHFPETLIFRDRVVRRLNLNLINLRPNRAKIQQRDRLGRLLFSVDPDACCYFNKIEPLNQLLKNYDVWISGVRRNQSAHRKALARMEVGPSDTTRYHPMLDWDAQAIYYYRRWHALPDHPLEEKGYSSIGCMPCTACVPGSADDERSGRWAGLNKTECGLHSTMVERGPES